MPREDKAATGAGALPGEIERLAESLVTDDMRPVAALFRKSGAPPPVITWSPVGEIPAPVLQTFREVCDVLANPEGFIDERSLRLEDFDGLERWIMLVRRAGRHYRYEYYGAEISNHFGTDMTGRSTADFKNHVGTFYAALYSAASIRRERVLSVHEPPARVFVRLWRRLVVPMTDSMGEISGFVVANVPENELRAGLDMVVDPVLVTDGSGLVQYYNNAARNFFGISSGQRRPLQAITGLDTAGLPAPEILLARQEVVERLELVQRGGGLMERIAVSVSAAEHRGRAYYVILLRAVGID